MIQADNSLQGLDLRLLRADLCLLFFESVDHDDSDAVVLHAFDLALVVVGDEQRLDFGDFFGDETEVVLFICYLIEGDGAQAVDEIQARGQRGNVALIT